MLGGRPASGRDVVWKNRKGTSKKLEEILASKDSELLPSIEPGSGKFDIPKKMEP